MQFLAVYSLILILWYARTKQRRPHATATRHQLVERLLSRSVGWAGCRCGLPRSFVARSPTLSLSAPALHCFPFHFFMCVCKSLVCSCFCLCLSRFGWQNGLKIIPDFVCACVSLCVCVCLLRRRLRHCLRCTVQRMPIIGIEAVRYGTGGGRYTGLDLGVGCCSLLLFFFFFLIFMGRGSGELNSRKRICLWISAIVYLYF